MSQTFAQILQSIPNSETRQAMEMLFRLILSRSFNDDSHSMGKTKEGQGHMGISTVQFDLDFDDGSAEGRLQWNQEDGTLEYGLPGGVVNLQIGQENVAKCRNSSGSDIPDGSAVRITGAQNDRPKITPAQADSVLTAGVFGITTEPIANNQFGFVTLHGLVRGIDTSGFVEGATLWLSTSVAGAFQATMPTAPDRKVAIGYAVKIHANEGVAIVGPVSIPGILHLSDVLLADPNDGDILVWSEANSRWQIQAPAP